MQKVVDCSIIIPVFNAEKTILKTLNSFLLGTNSVCNTEIILINDGSTDKSQEVIKNYIKNFDNIKLISTKNGGVSAARNIGLSHAQGRYVYFADADDFVHYDVLVNMMAIADRSCADIVFANYETEDIFSGVKTTHKCKIPCGVDLEKDYIERTLLYRFCIGDNIGLSMLWNKLYSFKLFQKTSIRFDEKMAHGEDWEFNIKILQIAKHVIAIDETVYTYRIDGTQNYSKYRKNLGYSFANGYDTICGLNAYYKFFADNSAEAKRVAVGFFTQIAEYLKMEIVPNKDKREFIKFKAVKSGCKKILGIKNSELSSYDISRRTKLAAMLILMGSIKFAIRIY